MKQLQNIKVARVSTVPFIILTQLREQIEAIENAGALVSIVSSNDELSKNLDLSDGCEFIPVYIPREINIPNDLIALFKLWKLFRIHRFDIVHSTTPKAGLLCAIAGKLARVPIRLHTFTGQTWVTLNGVKKNIVKFCDKIIGTMNTRCYADSLSQKEYLIQHKIMTGNKLFVLGKGSLAGVNIKRFSKSRFPALNTSQIKSSLGIKGEPLIILFVGRMTRDKGIIELTEAFEQIIKKNSDVILLLTGPIENDLGSGFQIEMKKRFANKVIFTGFSAEPERFMAIADIFCIPSYREGFGTVAIEAAVMGLPVVGTKIYGLTDAVIDNVTGILIEPRDSSKLVDALERLIYDEQLRVEMGQRAKDRAIKDFDSKNCNGLLIREYSELLKSFSSSIQKQK